VLEQKDRELASVQRELNDLRRGKSELEATVTRLQGEIVKKQRDYDVIILELENRNRTDNTHHNRADELERANERIQRQLAEVEARFQTQSRELERARTSPNVPN